MDMVTQQVCNIQHEHIEQNFEMDRQRLQTHGAQLDAMEKLAVKQTSVIEGMARRLDALDTRLCALEKRPQHRMERVMDTALQWATLLAWGLFAAKMGLG